MRNNEKGETRNVKTTVISFKLILVKSGALYGVKLWECQKQEEIERIQARLIKMALGLAQNTPDYLWKLEAGQKSIKIGAKKRASN